MTRKQPKPVKVKLSIYLPPHLLEQAQAFADADDRSLSWVVQRCVEVGLGEVVQGRRVVAGEARRQEQGAQLPSKEETHARTHSEAPKDAQDQGGRSMLVPWEDRGPTF